MIIPTTEAPKERIYDNWLEAFLRYTSYGEAPKRMYFWAGVSAIAGALERRVWIEQSYFRWYPNMYIIFVAPPGIVAKSTTSGLAMELLQRVPSISFGSTILTWQSLIKEFEDSATSFEYKDMMWPMSALMIESSELGNTINTEDRQLIDLLTALWDGKTVRKSTKYGGKEIVENPCINLIGCTTPSWIADNFSGYTIGGGLMSRMIFVYAEKKEKFVAYPIEHVPADAEETKRKLAADLHSISSLVGEFQFTNDALKYGREWYEVASSTRPANLSDDRFSGYIARKQTHLHKLAMILSVARGNSLVIEVEDLANADLMLTDIEPELSLIFSRAGKPEISDHVNRLLAWVESKGRVRLIEAYQFLHPFAPRQEEFESLVQGCLKAGWLIHELEDNAVWLRRGVKVT